MYDHIHIIAQCSDMIKFVRSFKSYTAKEIKSILERNGNKLCFKTLCDLGRKVGQNFKVWQNGNWPEIVESVNFFEQKLNYIHENPVAKWYVEKEEDWRYSSARNYINNDNSVIDVVVE